MVRPTSQKTVVSKLFSSSSRPIFILDASGRIAYCNEALAAWVGVAVDDLINQRCVYGNSKGRFAEIANQLCPPPHDADSRPQQWYLALTPHGSSTAQTREATCFALDRNQLTAARMIVLDSEETQDVQHDPFDAAALHRQLGQQRSERSEAYSQDVLIGQSPAMRRVRKQIPIAAKSECRTLIVGRPGTGREQLARTIHQQRTQGRDALIPLSCSVLDSELLEATLESVLRQSAELTSEGLGTLLLLDVDELSPECQTTLLGFMEIAEFNLQTIATAKRSFHTPATNTADTGSTHFNPTNGDGIPFRAELIEHLTELTIAIPNLMDRLDDVPLLAQWFVENANQPDKQLGGFSREAMEALVRYSWPREVEELKEVVSAAVRSATGSLIETADLPSKLALAATAATVAIPNEERIHLDAFLAEVEAELIQRALRQAKGNKAQAARALDISRGKLLRRIEQLGIEGA